VVGRSTTSAEAPKPEDRTYAPNARATGRTTPATISRLMRSLLMAATVPAAFPTSGNGRVKKGQCPFDANVEGGDTTVRITFTDQDEPVLEQSDLALREYLG
jgi:hypothetical protein